MNFTRMIFLALAVFIPTSFSMTAAHAAESTPTADAPAKKEKKSKKKKSSEDKKTDEKKAD